MEYEVSFLRFWASYYLRYLGEVGTEGSSGGVANSYSLRAWDHMMEMYRYASSECEAVRLEATELLKEKMNELNRLTAFVLKDPVFRERLQQEDPELYASAQSRPNKLSRQHLASQSMSSSDRSSTRMDSQRRSNTTHASPLEVSPVAKVKVRGKSSCSAPASPAQKSCTTSARPSPASTLWQGESSMPSGGDSRRQLYPGTSSSRPHPAAHPAPARPHSSSSGYRRPNSQVPPLRRSSDAMKVHENFFAEPS